MLLHQRHHSFPVSFVFHPSPSKIGSFNVLQTRSLLKLSEYWTCEHLISENRINIGLVNIFQIIQTLWKLDWWVSVKEPRHQICLNSKQWTRNFQAGKTKLIFVSLLLKDIKSMNIAMENSGPVNTFRKIQALWRLDRWTSVKEPRQMICLNFKRWTRNFKWYLWIFC